MTDDTTSYYSADDDTTTSCTNSTPIAANSNIEEVTPQDNDEEIDMNLFKSKLKHLFILSENGSTLR